MNKQKYTNNLSYLLYILSLTVFIVIDYSFEESISVFFNIFLLFVATSSFVLLFKFAIEVAIVKAIDHFFERRFTLNEIIDFQKKSLCIPTIFMLFNIVIQLVFIQNTANTYQAVILGLAQVIYIAVLIFQVNRKGYYTALNFGLGFYVILNILYQYFVILNIQSTV